MGNFKDSSAPTEPSSLHILSGPTSPASPKSRCTLLPSPNLPSPRAEPRNAIDERYQIPVGLPSLPMPWIWSCHKCHTRYHLGATRRCLQDGHYFCGGTTVDPISGKVKKHRACVSEFDYSGWENFSRWKRATRGNPGKHVRKHCQDECDFPSCCHWKEQDAVQNTKFGFLDSSCIDKKPDSSSVMMTVQANTMDYVGKFKRAAERHTIEVAKALDMPEKAQRPSQIDDVLEEDINMKEWITESPPSHPCPEPDAVDPPFDFKFEQEPICLVDDDDSPVSPRRSLWDWTAGEIGIALSPPALPTEGELWEEETEGEVNDVDML